MTSRRRNSGETVREMLGDPVVLARLSIIYAEEVVPGFALHDMRDEARGVHEMMVSIDARRYVF